jgi:hypothetical protein
MNLYVSMLNAASSHALSASRRSAVVERIWVRINQPSIVHSYHSSQRLMTIREQVTRRLVSRRQRQLGKPFADQRTHNWHQQRL